MSQRLSKADGTTEQRAPGRLEFLRHLGPGLISGVTDDDPSGIATYSQAGAQLGYAACWIMLLCYPLMAITQEISARIGRATGTGVVGIIRRHYPLWILKPVVALVAFANVVNLGADLGAMADVLRLLVGGSPHLYVVLFGGLCAGLLTFLRYDRYVSFMKWASLSLFAYFLTAFSVPIPWHRVLYHTLVPSLPLDASAIAVFVAVMGTSISPYLFIWQSSLEGERARGLPKLRRHSPTGLLAGEEVNRIRIDTSIGMAFATLVAYAVIVTVAATLHEAGITDIATTAQAAEALRPATGRFAYAVFSLGIIGTGLLAVPMLAGSAAYAIAEGRRWPVGLARAPHEARAFYGCILAATIAGVAMNFARIDPIHALLWSAVINGLLAVPVLVLMMLIAVKPGIMGQLVLGRRLTVLGWLAVAIMAATALGLLLTLGQ
ncbi:iron transporter [Aliidongia dinghuensis]|uniref:Iron transporter n=1 Tax=Aliidongia dinghuensis TaxID=1867774 RepID=A0A8J2YT77_9PROT|nr:divalent metal cation transporter [Aliidongia dinghuensis]GGF13107.1 iron transporter [Aliidongia dinghuensis]